MPDDLFLKPYENPVPFSYGRGILTSKIPGSDYAMYSACVVFLLATQDILSEMDAVLIGLVPMSHR
jgi:hypothetical protein